MGPSCTSAIMAKTEWYYSGLERLMGNRNSHALLVGVRISTTTLENCWILSDEAEPSQTVRLYTNISRLVTIRSHTCAH